MTAPSVLRNCRASSGCRAQSSCKCLPATLASVVHRLRVNLQIVANTAPSVTLSSPADDAEYRTGDTVTLSATATDSQDNISSVKFYVGGRLVNTDTSSPYSYAWTATLGSHSIRARVTDSGGLSAYSSTHDITVTAPLAAPTGVRIVGKSDNTDSSYELRWNAVSRAGAYWVVGSVNGACVTPYCLLVYTSASRPQRQFLGVAEPVPGAGRCCCK